MYRVDSEDYLAARCTYNSSTRDSITSMGSTADDEMCNLYIMYFMKAKGGRSFGMCVDIQEPELVNRLPSGSDEALPPNPALEEQVHSKKGLGDEEADIYTNMKKMFTYQEADGWPIGANQFGQITAVDIDVDGNIVIFHRGSHVWNGR